MAGIIDIFNGYEDCEFPGDQGISQPVIDQFVDLFDSLVVSQVRDDQKVWAQYQRKLANVTNELKTWFVFDAATPAGTGTCGIGTYSVACPVPEGSGLVGTSGDDSVYYVSKPYEFRIPLNELFLYTSPDLTTINCTGVVLPFEVVITSSEGYNYTNMPYKEKLLRQGEAHWNNIIGTGNVLVSACIGPRRTSTGALQSASIYARTGNNPSQYNTSSFMGALRVAYSSIRTADHFIVRGVIYDLARTGLGTWISSLNTTTYESQGSLAELVVSIVKVEGS